MSSLGAIPDHVYVIVLAAALLHASWNALIKISPDRLLSTVAIGVFSGLIAVCALPWLPLPARASWPYAATSLVLQLVYMRLIAAVYGRIDMSLGYPLMRGSAPLLVAAASVLLLGEALAPLALAGVVALCAGILLIGFSAGLRHKRGLWLALLNAAIIATYTLIDGLGVRQSGSAAAYTLWIFALQGAALLALGVVARGARGLGRFLRAHWRASLFGGFGSLASYGAALWAMTLAPIAVVAALRETSILFGLLISWWLLRERLGWLRICGAAILVAGAIALRLD